MNRPSSSASVSKSRFPNAAFAPSAFLERIRSAITVTTASEQHMMPLMTSGVFGMNDAVMSASTMSSSMYVGR